MLSESYREMRFIYIEEQYWNWLIQDFNTSKINKWIEYKIIEIYKEMVYTVNIYD